MSISDFYKTFSGSDALCFAHLKGFTPRLLGQITTISHSIKRSTQPVNVLGKNKLRGFTKGPAFVAGSMFFSMINYNIVKEFEILLHSQLPKDRRGWRLDELPPFNLIIITANEYGAASHMVIDNIVFTDEAGIVSINDIITETQTSYLARDVKPFGSFDYIIGTGLDDAFVFEDDSPYDDSVFGSQDFSSFPKDGNALTYAMDFFNVVYETVENNIIFKTAEGIVKTITKDNLGSFGLSLNNIGNNIKNAVVKDITMLSNFLLGSNTSNKSVGVYSAPIQLPMGKSTNPNKQSFNQKLLVSGKGYLLDDPRINY